MKTPDCPIRATLDLYEASEEHVKEQLSQLSWDIAKRLKSHEGSQYRLHLCFQIVKDMIHPYGDKVAISERQVTYLTTNDTTK